MNQHTIEGLTAEELERYRRHLTLPEIGIDGQLRLKTSRVLMIGAGGLGAPAGLYLAAAGVGRIGLVDPDVVDASNLQRQVAFGTRDLGRPKVEAARERLSDLNPGVDFVLHRTRFSRANAGEIIGGYDIIVDGSDNFATRYLVNDTCVELGKPFVYASVSRFEGQVSVFADRGGPCYRCLYPSPPPPGRVPDCSEGGVLGVLPGILGAIQAAEAIKWIVRAGTLLSGRLLLFDALAMSFRELELSRNPECPACGPNRAGRKLDAGGDCAARAEEDGGDVAVPEIGVKELKRKLDAGENVLVLDVREPHEYKICNLGGLLIPLGELPARMQDLDSERDIVVHCRTGSRSAQAVEFLRDAGFERVWNLKGGIRAWSDEIDASVPKY